MSWDEGFSEAVNDLLRAFAFVLIILILFSVITIVNNFVAAIGSPTLIDAKTIVELMLLISIPMGVVGGVRLVLKAVRDPDWGISYAIALLLLSFVGIPIILVLLQNLRLSISQNILDIVDPSTSILLALVGAIIGIVIGIKELMY